MRLISYQFFTILVKTETRKCGSQMCNSEEICVIWKNVGDEKNTSETKECVYDEVVNNFRILVKSRP